MKRTIRIIAGCLLAALLLSVATTASAGMLDRWKKNTDRKRNPAPRYDHFPTLSFATGEVQSGFQGWKVGDLDVVLAPDCVVSGVDGEPATLQAGGQAVVAGSRLGNTIIALRVKVLPPNWDYGPQDPNVTVERSETDPTVGVGTGPL